MKALIDLAGMAARREWARREHARLQADIVEARLAAAGAGAGPFAPFRRWLADGVSGRLGTAERSARRARPARPAHPVHAATPGCRRAAARSFHVARTAGGTR